MRFEQGFCNSTIGQLLENKFIIEGYFLQKKLQKTFIKDGIKLAFADKDLHLYEMNWLKTVADKNDIDASWGFSEFEKFKQSDQKSQVFFEFEIEKMFK